MILRAKAGPTGSRRVCYKEWILKAGRGQPIEIVSGSQANGLSQPEILCLDPPTDGLVCP